MFTISGAPKCSNAPVLPGPYNEVSVILVHSDHLLTTPAHDSVNRFNAMDAVPEKIRMCFLDSAGSINIHPCHFSNGSSFRNILYYRRKAKRRTGKDGHVIFFS